MLLQNLPVQSHVTIGQTSRDLRAAFISAFSAESVHFVQVRRRGHLIAQNRLASIHHKILIFQDIHLKFGGPNYHDVILVPFKFEEPILKKSWFHYSNARTG